MSISEDNYVKVVLQQAHDEDEEVDVEVPWALALGDNQYQLKNFPFFFYGLSFDDVFEALPIYADDPRPYFTRVIKKSGHRTIRISFENSVKESTDSQDVLTTLSKMGCGSEGTNGTCFFVINIQPHCNFEEVCSYLTSSSVEFDWEHADPTYEELYPDGEI